MQCTADRERDRQKEVELSMQQITAVTSCDHRRNEKQGDRERVTAGEREREREADTGEEGGKRRCG